VRGQKAVPGAVVAIQTFGNFTQGFHPHLHILVSDGCFHENGMFSVSPSVDTKTLEQIFRYKVLKMFIRLERASFKGQAKTMHTTRTGRAAAVHRGIEGRQVRLFYGSFG